MQVVKRKITWCNAALACGFFFLADEEFGLALGLGLELGLMSWICC